jgi:hypothetical protein
MGGNPIDEGLRSDHLFLLIGGNPAPNWVAAGLLLRDGGQIYLVHSPDTAEVAKRIGRWLMELEYGMKQPRPRRDGCRRGRQRRREITSAQVGLDCTGSTKVLLASY